MSRIRDWRWWVVGVCIIGGLLGILAAGYFAGQWGMQEERAGWKKEREDWADERDGLYKRFPQVRKETEAACTLKYQDKIADLQSRNEQSAQSLADLKQQMDETHELAAYTLRFLGDRAKINDQRQASMMRQAREANQKIEVVAQKTAVVEQKATVAASKADEAAITAKAVDKKLETAVQPPLPAKPWVGTRR